MVGEWFIELAPPKAFILCILQFPATGCHSARGLSEVEIALFTTPASTECCASRAERFLPRSATKYKEALPEVSIAKMLDAI